MRSPPGRLMLAALGAALLAASTPAVARVVDGDTLQVRVNGAVHTVHLAGVDAPERGACGSGEARRALARLLPRGARVRLRRDPAAPGTRYVYRRGRLVNAALVRGGAARPGHTDGLRKRSALLAAAREAEQQRRGIWTACAAPPPPPATGEQQDPITRARAELADRVFVLKTGTSLYDRSERRLHLCRDGFAGDYWSWVFHSNTGSGSLEGSWEVVSADATTARVRLFNADGEIFRTFSIAGGRVSIDGVAITEVAASDVCAIRRHSTG